MHPRQEGGGQTNQRGDALTPRRDGREDGRRSRALQMLPVSGDRRWARRFMKHVSTHIETNPMSMRKTQPVAPRDLDYLTIVAISDTHQLHREVEVPPGDLLIHAGDFTMFSRSAAAILDFNEWLGELPHRWKIIIPGNHEFFLAEDPPRRKWIRNATVLINESIEIMGLRIWGSPMTPLYGGAFGRSSDQDRASVYSRIPADTDILVTHGPPYGI